MISIQLNKIKNINCDSRKFEIKELTKLKNELNKKKNELNKPYKTKRYFELSKIPSLGKISSKIKYNYYNKYNAINVTNAWFKIYEIMYYYKLIDNTNGTFRYFDNAAFPGSFILAVNHYVNTIKSNTSLEWYGSSYIGGGELEDQYLLYKNYPKRWTMSKNNNGDIRDIKVILDIVKQISTKVDLYTSDLGINVDIKLPNKKSGWDYQEELHANGNLGQVLLGLLILKKNRHMVIKMYTFFTSRSVSLLAILTTLFKNVYISKPEFSAIRSSEIYLVCKEYKGYSYFNNTGLYEKIIHRLNDKYNNLSPIVTRECITEKFIKSIIEYQTFLTKRQIMAINKKLDVFYYKIKIKDLPPITLPSFLYTIKKINRYKMLNVKNIYSSPK